MRHLQLLALTLVLVLLAPATRAAGPEDSTQGAQELVKQGSAEYAKHHWEAARVAFLRAWELDQHYALAGSLADVELKLGRYRDAAEHLKYALANLPPEHPERRADAEASLKECRTHLGALRVSVSGILVLVKLDDQSLPFQSLRDEILLDPGSHKLVAEQRGYLTESREFSAVAGQSLEFRLDLVPLPVAPDAESERSAHGAAREPQAKAPGEHVIAHTPARTWVVVGGSAATVLATGLGTYFTIRYFALKSESETTLAQVEAQSSPALVAKNSECSPGVPMRSTACDQLARTTDARVTADNVATGSLITAGALGVATLATYLLWPTTQDGTVEKHARMSITPWLTGARGGALQVDF
jgi:hypothetical protein